MKILVTNDDGINNHGLWTLVEALKEVADVTVVAPDREQSGVGFSLSLGAPIKVHRLPYTPDGVSTFSVEGTPGDAVILGLAQLAPDTELVVAGVNQGHNTSNEILLSGTVGAALHARFRGVPAMALSVFQLDSTHHDIAAAVAAMIVRRMKKGIIPMDMLLNVNVPHAEVDAIEGVEVTRLAQRVFADKVEEQEDPRKRKHYFLMRGRENVDIGEGTDFGALKANKISLTPLDNFLSPLPDSLIPPEVCQELLQELKALFPAKPPDAEAVPAAPVSQDA